MSRGLRSFRRLLKAQRHRFAGDAEMIAAARHEVPSAARASAENRLSFRNLDFALSLAPSAALTPPRRAAAAAAAQTRTMFEANRGEADPAELERMFAEAEEGIDFVLRGMVQGVLNERDTYELKYDEYTSTEEQPLSSTPLREAPSPTLDVDGAKK